MGPPYGPETQGEKEPMTEHSITGEMAFSE
jgi:hypothetical protein